MIPQRGGRGALDTDDCGVMEKDGADGVPAATVL